jgi:hypothetical protein
MVYKIYRLQQNGCQQASLEEKRKEVSKALILKILILECPSFIKDRTFPQ